jgi:exonuclease VII small subunit
MAKEKSDTKNLNSNLKRLSEITEWFENQEEIDVEEGLKKVKEAVELIKASRERLKTVENEFKEIKKEINVKESDEGKGEENDEPNTKDTPF